jgi:hypothetical protein
VLASASHAQPVRVRRAVADPGADAAAHCAAEADEAAEADAAATNGATDGAADGATLSRARFLGRGAGRQPLTIPRRARGRRACGST